MTYVYSYKPLSDLNSARYTGQYGSCMPSSPLALGNKIHSINHQHTCTGNNIILKFDCTCTCTYTQAPGLLLLDAYEAHAAHHSPRCPRRSDGGDGGTALRPWVTPLAQRRDAPANYRRIVWEDEVNRRGSHGG